MKKIISTLLAIIFLASFAAPTAFAEEEPVTELENVAIKGLGYCSSMKNSDWTPPSTINDGVSNDWPGWEPAYPNVPPTMNTSEGFDGEYCGVKFLNNEYYEISKINVVLGLHAQYTQNPTYTVKALVEGEWKEIATFKDEDAKPRSYASYQDAMEKDTSNYHIRSDISIDLDTPVNTNNVRIIVDDFAKSYPGGDVLVFPYIYEVELIGKRGETPDITLPENAVFSQNAAYNSIPRATTSKELAYPFLAIDGKDTTAWKPGSLEAGQAITLELEKEYTVDKITLNFGNVTPAQIAGKASFKIEAFVGGTWQKLADACTYNETAASCVTEHQLASPIKTNQVRIVFEQALTVAPSLYEFEVNIVGERTYYLESKFSAFQKQSAAKGNLAILGTAYASENRAPYSEPSFINDGRILKNSNVWFSGLVTTPVNCGVKLDKTYTVNKVVVYCSEPAKIGKDVMHFNIVAKVNGEDKIIAQGRSYDAKNIVESSESRYTTVYTFPEGVVTDDIKIEFTRSSSTIPNVLELEIYSDNSGTSAFTGYPTEAKEPTYTPVELPPDEEPAQPGNTSDKPIETVILIVAICVVAATAAGVASFFVVKKVMKKKTSLTQTTEDAQEAQNDDAPIEQETTEQVDSDSDNNDGQQ